MKFIELHLRFPPTRPRILVNPLVIVDVRDEGESGCSLDTLETADSTIAVSETYDEVARMLDRVARA